MAPGRTTFYRFGIILVGGLIIVLCFIEFRYESQALLWHLAHGSTYRWQGLIIPVPLMYIASTGESSRSIQIFTLPGKFRARRKTPFGVISAFRVHDEAEGSEIEDLDKKIVAGREKQGFRLTNSRPIVVAGTPMQCQERLAENFRSYGPAFIVNCQAVDKSLFIEFDGSASLLNEFYSLAGEMKAANPE